MLWSEREFLRMLSKMHYYCRNLGYRKLLVSRPSFVGLASIITARLLSLPL